MYNISENNNMSDILLLFEHQKEESNEPEYNEDKDQLREKQEEQETGEMTLNATANQVF